MILINDLINLLNSIESVSLPETYPETISVVREGPVTLVGDTVTIGAQVPNAPADILWAQGMLQLSIDASKNGAIYEIQTDGTSLLKYDTGESLTGTDTFIRIVTCAYGSTTLWKCIDGVLNSSLITLSGKAFSGSYNDLTDKPAAGGTVGFEQSFLLMGS